MAYGYRSSRSTTAAVLEQHVTIPLRADGGLRLAVIADTHSRPHPRSLEFVAAHKPDAILHAGDIGDLDVIDRFRTVAAVFAVRGNIDGRGPQLPDQLEIELSDDSRRLPSQALAKILLLHIGVNGPKLRADAARFAAQKRAQLVVCGHSHVPFIGEDRGVTIFNPGSIGPRRFNLPIVFGVVDLTPDRLNMWHVDCETGHRWMPPR